MEQRQDYIESQVEVLSKILRRLLEKLLGIKSDDSELDDVLNQGITVVAEELKLRDIAKINNDNLVETLLKDYNYDNQNIKLLADVLYTLSKHTDKNHFGEKEKALILYNYYIANAKGNIDFVAFSRREELTPKGFNLNSHG